MTKHTCEYLPVTFGDYNHPAPDPVECGADAEIRLRATYYNDDGSVDHSDEVYSCLDCFAEALQWSGHPSDFDPTSDDLDEFDPMDHDPGYGPRYEVLEKL